MQSRRSVFARDGVSGIPRLKRARQLLMQSDHGVAQVAFQVGYASASQFSREFRRAFGHPPSAARQHPSVL